MLIIIYKFYVWTPLPQIYGILIKDFEIATRDVYHIAGNFRMVQNFVVFADGVATVKIKPQKFQ